MIITYFALFKKCPYVHVSEEENTPNQNIEDSSLPPHLSLLPGNISVLFIIRGASVLMACSSCYRKLHKDRPLEVIIPTCILGQTQRTPSSETEFISRGRSFQFATRNLQLPMTAGMYDKSAHMDLTAWNQQSSSKNFSY